ncbi:MAG: pilus assembly protein N-terminal domain-containing protein, partial [Burkholderiales bacterium]|nr:pilus assembly protein N-terminal domain-containing protein [Burkholderiales bacterium]
MKFFRAVLVMSLFALLSACGGGGGSAGNTSGVALFSTASDKVTILPGAAQTYNVGGGIPGYSATSSSGAATVSINGKVLTITGSGSGTTVVTITDAAGTKIAIDVTVGTGSEFFTSAPEKVSVGIGATTSTFVAGGGSGIYIVASGNRQIVTVTQSGSQFFLTGVSVGTTTVTVSDNAGGSAKIDVTVGSGVDLYTTAPSAVTVAVGSSSAIYSIGGGSQVYSISSGDQSIATVGISNRNEFIISGKAGGSTVVIVKDSLGKSVNIDVVVGSKTKLFSTAAPDIKLDVGGSNIFKVGGGTTVYNVGSSNNSVATASLSGNDLTIVGVATGVATIIVTDSASNSLTINVSVGTGAITPLFTSAGSDIVVSLGSQPTFNVSGGKAPYSISSTNSAVVSALISGSTMTISGISEGSAKVILTDAAGAKVTVNVTVGSGLVVPLFTTAPSTVTIAPLAVATYTVGGGTAPYTFTSNNTAVASVVGSG